MRVLRRPCDEAGNEISTDMQQGTTVVPRKTRRRKRKALPINDAVYNTEGGAQKPTAWDEDNETEITNGPDYTYEDIAFIMDRICFVIFLCLNAIVSLVFFIVLEIGGRS